MLKSHIKIFNKTILTSLFMSAACAHQSIIISLYVLNKGIFIFPMKNILIWVIDDYCAFDVLTSLPKTLCWWIACLGVYVWLEM